MPKIGPSSEDTCRIHIDKWRCCTTSRKLNPYFGHDTALWPFLLFLIPFDTLRCPSTTPLGKNLSRFCASTWTFQLTLTALLPKGYPGIPHRPRRLCTTLINNAYLRCIISISEITFPLLICCTKIAERIIELSICVISLIRNLQILLDIYLLNDLLTYPQASNQQTKFGDIVMRASK